MQTPAYLDRAELVIPSAVVTLRRKVEPEPIPILLTREHVVRRRSSDLAETLGLVAMVFVVPALWLAIVVAWLVAAS